MVRKVQSPKPVPVPPQGTLAALVALRNHEINVRLQRVNLSVALNMAGMAGIMARLLFPGTVGSARTFELVVYWAFPFLAVGINLVWNKVIERNTALLNFWNDKIREVEEKCGLEGGIRLYTDEVYQRTLEIGPRFMDGWTKLSIAIIICWGCISYVSYLQLMKGVAT